MSEDHLRIGSDKPNQLGQCPSCRYYNIGKINFYEPDTPRSCSKGNSATLDKFFSDCGHLTSEQAKDYAVPCYKPTESSIILQNLIDMSSDLVERLKKCSVDGS